MPVTIPPWLQPINPVPYFLQGVQQGENIAEKQNSAERAIQEMTLRREAQQRAREQQEAQMAMRQQQFALEQQASQVKARDAAMKYQWQRELGSRVEAGEDPMEAWVSTASKYAPERVPGAVLRQQDITQTAADRKAAADALAANRAAQLALGKQRLEQTQFKQEADIASRRQAAWQRQYDNLSKNISKIKQQLTVVFDPDDKTQLMQDLRAAQNQLRDLEEKKPGSDSVVLRRKSDGKYLRYKGDPEDVSTEQFDIIY